VKPLFVLDASVSAGWIFQDQADTYCDGILDALRAGACIAPALWKLEMANILLTAERKGKISRMDSERTVSALKDLPIKVYEQEGERYLDAVRDLGRDYGLSAYDAVYLDMALKEGLPLATRDVALAAAIQAAGGSVFEA
jgi:predicted nucleic acid-binding protein